MPSKKGKKTTAIKAKENLPVFRVIADNRRARFDYDLMERIEAGIALTGTEIKAVRAGRVNIRDAYAQAQATQMWLHNLHIGQWGPSGPWGHDPTRSRRLLLHKTEIAKLRRSAGEKGLTIVPVRVYIKGHHAKVEIALAKGRRRYDKRRVIMQRETEREIRRALRRER